MMARVRTHSNPFHYYLRMEPIPFEERLPQYKDKLDLEIGCGRGIFLREYAKRCPDRPIVGIEVRKQMVEILQERIEAAELSNILLIHGSAKIFMEDCLQEGHLEKVFLFHPDPWFKKRHHNRRVVSPEFLALLANRMAPEGRFYVSTDVRELWEEIFCFIMQSGQFKVLPYDPFWPELYTSHWTEFTLENDRPLYSGTFVRISNSFDVSGSAI